MAAGLEQLDAYGALDELPWSLDDPVWDLLFPAEIPDQCGTFTLEMLDNFGTLDSLAYSLDDPFWQQTICTRFGQGVSWAKANVSATANARFVASADVIASAEISASPSRIVHDSASIDAQADLSASASAVLGGYANVVATAAVDAAPTRILSAAGSIYAYAEVSAYANAIWSDSASVDASASVSSDSVRIRTGAGDVSASASVESDSIRFRTSTADIAASAGVTALGGVVYAGEADVLATASFTAIANAIFSAYGNVNASALVDAVGTRLGENWSGTTPGTGDYTTPSTGGGSYTPVDPGTGTFTPVTPPFNEWGSIAPAIGERFQGGYYAGEYVLDGVTYFLILADKVYEERAGYVTGALSGVSNYKLYVSDTDGLSATNWIAFPTTVQTRANTNSFYYKIRQKNISGTTDWYYPSRAELQTIVQNLYPTTTNATLFKTGGSQALGTSNPAGYWTSSIRPIYNYPSGFSWYLWASETKYGGGMYSPPYGSNVQEYLFYFRPIRRVRK